MESSVLKSEVCINDIETVMIYLKVFIFLFYPDYVEFFIMSHPVVPSNCMICLPATKALLGLNRYWGPWGHPNG